MICLEKPKLYKSFLATERLCKQLKATNLLATLIFWWYLCRNFPCPQEITCSKRKTSSQHPLSGKKLYIFQKTNTHKKQLSETKRREASLGITIECHPFLFWLTISACSLLTHQSNDKTNDATVHNISQFLYCKKLC